MRKARAPRSPRARVVLSYLACACIRGTTYFAMHIDYELGYAHGVGNLPSNTLLIARKGTKLHFDIANMRVQFYGSTRHLRRLVRDNLSSMIKSARKGVAS